MGLALLATVAVAFVLLPLWAAETAAIRGLGRRPQQLARCAAFASVLTAGPVLLAACYSHWLGPLSPAVPLLLLGLLATDVAGVVWAYTARPAVVVARGFPVEPSPAVVPPSGDESV